MKKFLLLITVVLLISQLHAQQVVNNAGGIAKNSQYEISWGLGELAIHTFTSENYTITQGFHQSLLTVTGINEGIEPGFEISVFPNPTQNFVNLELGANSPNNLEYQVYGQKGQLIERKPIHAQPVKVSFLDLAGGVYFIKVFMDDKKVKTFKIVKE
jgi:hypothetical protein